MKGERLSARGLKALQSRLSQRDIAAVQDVATCKLMTGQQLQMLHFPAEHRATAHTAARTCRRVLERLTNERLLIRLNRHIGGQHGGSSGFIYALAPLGQRVLELDGPRRRFREPTATFADHTLAIADIVVNLRQLARRGSIEILGLQTEPVCWRSFGMPSVNVLRPDLFVAIGIGDYEYRTFSEIDLGTEGLPRLLGKCKTYNDYFCQGTEQHLYGVFPKVVWLLNNLQRATRLQEAIERSSKLHTELFSVGHISQALKLMSDGELQDVGGNI